MYCVLAVFFCVGVSLCKTCVYKFRCGWVAVQNFYSVAVTMHCSFFRKIICDPFLSEYFVTYLLFSREHRTKIVNIYYRYYYYLHQLDYNYYYSTLFVICRQMARVIAIVKILFLVCINQVKANFFFLLFKST